MKNCMDLIGKKFGTLIVQQGDGYDSNTRDYYWICKCEKCGAVKRVPTRVLNTIKKENRDGCRHIKSVNIGDRFGKLVVEQC